MSDRSAACIEIGGTLKRADIPKFVEAILADGVGNDWECDFADRREAEAYIEAAAGDGHVCLFYDAAAPGGIFPAFEAACRELGLAYHRADDGHYAYPPMHGAWFPGMDSPVETGGTIEQGPLVSLAELRQLHDAGTSLAEVLVSYDAALRGVPALRIED